MARLGIDRLNVGSGAHVARDYGDPNTLYIDRDSPIGEIAPGPLRDLIFVDGVYPYLQTTVPPLPLANSSTGQILCEHLVEHLTPPLGVQLVKEFHRTLRPGGVLRMSTPDLARFVGLLQHESTEFASKRRQTLADLIAADAGLRAFAMTDTAADLSPAYLVNHIFRFWGHQWIYDQAEMRRLLIAGGFADSDITFRGFKEGHAGLAELDNRYHREESLYVEAVAR